MKNVLDKQYQDLLRYIIEDGVTKQTRNGETLSVFGYQIMHNMQTGFPLLTTKKMAWKQIVTELMWFLRGDTNIKYLVDNDCHIWDGDAYKNYLNKDYSFFIKNNSSELVSNIIIEIDKFSYRLFDSAIVLITESFLVFSIF